MRRRTARVSSLGAAVAVLAPMALAAAPAASAATAPACGAGSTVLVDNATPYVARVASYAASPTRTLVCAELGGFKLVAAVDTGNPVWVALMADTGTGACPVTVVDTQQPVRAAFSVGVDAAGAAVCVGDASGRTVVRVLAGTGSWSDVDVWVNYSCVVNIWHGHHRAGGGGDGSACTGSDEQLI